MFLATQLPNSDDDWLPSATIWIPCYAATDRQTTIVYHRVQTCFSSWYIKPLSSILPVSALPTSWQPRLDSWLATALKGKIFVETSPKNRAPSLNYKKCSNH